MLFFSTSVICPIFSARVMRGQQVGRALVGIGGRIPVRGGACVGGRLDLAAARREGEKDHEAEPGVARERSSGQHVAPDSALSLA